MNKDKEKTTTDFSTDDEFWMKEREFAVHIFLIAVVHWETFSPFVFDYFDRPTDRPTWHPRPQRRLRPGRTFRGLKSTVQNASRTFPPKTKLPGRFGIPFRPEIFLTCYFMGPRARVKPLRSWRAAGNCMGTSLWRRASWSWTPRTTAGSTSFAPKSNRSRRTPSEEIHSTDAHAPRSK